VKAQTMSFFIMLASITLLVAVVAFVMHNHWQEVHGDNHF
jgi:hypothetical protein